MYKNYLLLVFLLLSGCQSNQLQSFESQEIILVKINDYKQLIPLYKQQLSREDNNEIRLKLADTYLKSGDPESTLFTLQPLTAPVKPTAQGREHVQALMLQAYAQYELGTLDTALNSALAANEIQVNEPENENLLGMIYVSQHSYIQARHFFNLARSHFYDDITIQNNLAVLDIIEGKYEQSIQRLLLLQKSSVADPQVTANLLLAMAKLNNFSYVRSVLTPKYSDAEILDMYQILRDLKPAMQQVNDA
ncbi:lipopolysaccharide assembly protein LapB [Moritella sp. F3]|uniref:tetratricopeptide repeat protein n=1 Tax=Moritella sp. F3 TaxID=2718882 RepID=UPI0018E159B4|nr:hypothetical protein [Moritella sp. F3]GIC78874.1 hypothetical protein FMO001_36010 [Moritella sp. F1]GIC81891.1 hypothetical protein FMO003_21720 [Moritella sp. F3]